MLEVISKATGIEIQKFEEQKILEGATEMDIVCAGLEEVMTSATEEVIETSLNNKVDLRTAAYINSIKKLDEFYKISGIVWFILNKILLYLFTIPMIRRSKMKSSQPIKPLHPSRSKKKHQSIKNENVPLKL